MDDRDSLIDYPHFHPNDKVVFPPTGPATDSRDKDRLRAAAHMQNDYTTAYPSDPPAVDASLGDGVDLYDPDTRVTDEQVKRYSEYADLKERPEIEDNR